MSLLDEIDQSKEIIEALKAFAKNPQGYILLAGKNGTGKTYASHKTLVACGIINSDHRLNNTQSEINLKWLEYINRYGSADYFLEQLKQSKVLLLDDIGTRVPSEAFMDFLYALVDYRYNNKERLGTIITTNLNAKDMREKFGDAFVSRVASGVCFRLEGKDRRFKDF